jgi:redox-sensitive bicupin YhaK (pirin superfamily)
LNLYSTVLDADTLLDFEFASGRHGFVQVVRGSVAINGESLGSGDAAALQDQDALSLRATEDSEMLLFDMA